MLFCVRQLREKSCEPTTSHCLSKLEESLCPVDRESLFAVQYLPGRIVTLFSLGKAFHSAMRGRVQYDGDLSERLSIKGGVKHASNFYAHHLNMACTFSRQNTM